VKLNLISAETAKNKTAILLDRRDEEMSNAYMIENKCYDEILDMEIAKINQVNEVLKEMGPCPRSADEVYSMSIKVVNFVDKIYSEMAAKYCDDRALQEEVSRQRVIKKTIRQLADHNLNQLLDYFYSHGGPIIEPPVSEQTAKEIQPFFSRITVNALTQIEAVTDRNQAASPAEAAEVISAVTVNMYEGMSRLYAGIPEVKETFEELMQLYKN